MGLYLNNGYINFEWIRSLNCTIVLLIGPRGTGKTYSILDYFYEKKIPIIFARRKYTQLQMCAGQDTSMYKVISTDRNKNIGATEIDQNYFIFKDEDGFRPAIGVALSKLYNLRGIDASGYKDLYFDEITPEPLEIVRQGEAKAFLHMYETFNRNRELDGEPPLNIILTGNADRLDTPILRALNLIPIVERMVISNQEIYIDKRRSIAAFYLINSKIAEKKAKTFLYQQTTDKEFTDVALSNKFADMADLSNIKRNARLKEYKPLFTLNNTICVYKHKSQDYLYVSAHTSGNVENFNLILTNDKKRFILKKDMIINMIIAQKIYFDSFDTKTKFEEWIY